MAKLPELTTHPMFKRENQPLSVLQIIGGWLLLLGIGLFLFGALYPFKTTDLGKSANCAAAGFFLIMMGIVLLFPDMLKDGDKSLSTMRVAVFMIVSVFSILCIKSFWDAGIQKLDGSWAAVIIAALGGKAIQSLGENNVFGSAGNQNPLTENPLFNGQAPPIDLPVSSNGVTRAPKTRPAHLLPKPAKK